MHSFKDYLLEAAMTLDSAMKVFGITSPFTSESDLKAHHKKLALQHHPDHGGSLEKMKDINIAKEVLAKNIGTKFDNDSFNKKFEKNKKEYADLKAAVNSLLLSKFHSSVYTKYFSDIFGKEFKAEVVTDKTDSYFSNMRTSLRAKFYDEAKDIVFDLYFGVDLIDIKYSKGLGGGDNLDFPILFTCEALVNGKKQKISQTNYKYSSDHNLFSNPETLLPKAKMSKFAKGEVRKNSKVKRSDFDLFFTKKYDAKGQKDGSAMYRYYINITPSIMLAITRSTFMKTPYYTIDHIASGTPTKFGGFKYDKVVKPIKTKYFEESQETLDFFKNLIDNLKSSGDSFSTFQKAVNQ